MNFLILPNQLFDINHIPKGYDIVLWECSHFFTAYKFNKKKLMLHKASMMYYYDYLIKNGYKVQYIDYLHKPNQNDKYILYNPLNKNLDLPKNCTILDSPNLLLSSELLQKYREKTSKFFFNAFYMWSKKSLNIISNIKSQDKYNRLRLMEKIQIKKIPIFKNCYIEGAINFVNSNFKDNYGNTDNFIYPISHKEAKILLRHFIINKLTNFGNYQDFIDKDRPHLYHSLLSSSLNIGLLNPKDIIDELEKVFNDIPINSYEGFIRQLFWREYQYYCYKYFDFSDNFFGNDKKLDIKWYNGTIGIKPVDDAIIEAFNSGYLHHIKRLMVIGNYMNLSEIDPKEGFKWFMEFSCDSYEWIMYQNVYEMVFFASGGKTMRRPYISSSNYIIKMSNYKKGDWCDKWNKLYKKFIMKHKDKLWKYRYFIAY